MRKLLVASALAGALTLMTTTALAAVELGASVPLKSIAPDAVAVAATADGQQLYALTKSGELQLFKANGTLEGSLNVGAGYTSVQPLGRGERVLLFGPGAGAKIVTIDILRTFDYAGLAVRGKPDAPVTITVFSDFQ